MSRQLEKQSDLLSSKDLSAFVTIQSMNPGNQVEVDEQLTDDEIAYNEALERGMTDDEKLYFQSVGVAK